MGHIGKHGRRHVIVASENPVRPELRKDAMERTVQAILRERNADGAEVLVQTGGTRGMRVNIKHADPLGDVARQPQEVLDGTQWNST